MIPSFTSLDNAKWASNEQAEGILQLPHHYLIQLIPKNLQCLCKDSEGWVPSGSVTSHPTSPGWEGKLSQTTPLYSFSRARDPQTCVQHASSAQVLLLASPRRAGHSFDCYSSSQGQFHYFHFSKAKTDSDALQPWECLMWTPIGVIPCQLYQPEKSPS